MYGFGQGAVGQNVLVQSATGTGAIAVPGMNGLAGAANGGFGIPAEIPFHSLSFPDIDHTVMRPAALPPGLHVDYTTNPPTPTYYTIPNASPLPGLPAGTLYGDGSPGAAPGINPWQNPATYLNVPATWGTFVGDPGVRNYLLFTGYPSAALENGSISLPNGWAMDMSTTSATTSYLGYPGVPTRAHRFGGCLDQYDVGTGVYVLAYISPRHPGAAVVPDSRCVYRHHADGAADGHRIVAE